ncbi:hypothetical protein NHG23_08705 [Aerococcaceae bacterium NML190073]|nr:hypothetical protein [Aerococcaceae bacterium NML190073]
MASMIALDIANGEMTWKEVPKFMRKAVKRKLKALGLEYLASDNPVVPTEEADEQA